MQQQSPYFNNALSPSENSKFIPSFQYFNNNSYNYMYSPRTLFFGLNLSNSSGGNNNKKYILSKMKFSSSNKKFFLSNKIKRNYNSDSYEKKTKKNFTNNNINNNNINNNTSTICINETKASTKKNNSTQNITNSAFVRMNKSAYIGSVKKNLLPSLSNELKSNTKKNKNINNNNDVYDNLCKTTENLDLEKMIDYIVSSTKIYNRYNDNKENISTNNFNLIYYNNNTDINNISDKKNIKKNNCNNYNENSQSNQKNYYSLCKCKRLECLKYSCSCLKSGNKCNNLCTCINCKNKENNIFKIDD